MRQRWPLILLGSLAVVALLAAACAPASESNDDSGTTTSSDTTTERPDVQTITQSTDTATGSGSSTDTTMEDTGETSVSGIPLDPDAVYGGVIRTTTTTEGPTFSNWEEAAGIAPFAMHPLHNMLIRPRTWGTLEDFENNAFFELMPDIATSWEQSSDGLAWTFKLRDGIDWSDGTPLTSADVKWSFDTIRTGEGLNRSPRSVHMLAIESITTPDPLTVVFNLSHPKPAILEVIGMPYHIIRPAHIYDGNTEMMREDLPTVTSGPFNIARWVPGESYVFERNPDYWDAPFPYLDGIEVSILSRSNAPIALRAGNLDVGAAQGYTGAQADTLIQECTVCAIWPRVIGSSTSPAVMLNHERAPWNDPAVKEAVALAIDNQKYITTVRDDWYFNPTGCGFYPTGKWAMPADRCAQIPGYGDAAGNEDPLVNKEEARQILADAGYEPNELKVSVAFWSSIQQDAPAIIEDLRAIGIDADAEILETARAYETWSAGTFDVGVHSFWIAGLDPDIVLYEHFYTGSDRNYNRYSNPEFDNLVDQMSATIDPETRKQRAWDAMEIALNEQAKIIVGHSSYIPVLNERVRNFMPTLNYMAGYGPQNRWDHTWLAE